MNHLKKRDASILYQSCRSDKQSLSWVRNPTGGRTAKLYIC